MSVVTIDALGVFWNGEEVAGFSVYGLWRMDLQEAPIVDWFEGVELRPTRLFGEGWTVWCWDVRVTDWPAKEKWPQLAQGVLSQLLELGACVAWGGLEGAFADPPDLFDPAEMSGGVWMARTSELALGPSGLDEGFEVLTDEELLLLRKACL